MAFQPGAVDYRSQIMAEERGLSRLNEAKDRQRQRQAEIDRKKASKRSGLSKLVSAGLRGAAAYYTGGLSETMGGGKLIDDVALGKGAERNEYGDLVGLGSSVYQGAKAKQAADIGKQDALFQKSYSRQKDAIDQLWKTDPAQAKIAQGKLSDFERDYRKNRGEAETSGMDFIWGDKLGMNKDYSSMIPMMSADEQEKERLRLVARDQKRLDKLMDDAVVKSRGDYADKLSKQKSRPSISNPLFNQNIEQ